MKALLLATLLLATTASAVTHSYNMNNLPTAIQTWASAVPGRIKTIGVAGHLDNYKVETAVRQAYPSAHDIKITRKPNLITVKWSTTFNTQSIKLMHD